MRHERLDRNQYMLAPLLVVLMRLRLAGTDTIYDAYYDRTMA